jgi:hypothetical protein
MTVLSETVRCRWGCKAGIDFIVNSKGLLKSKAKVLTGLIKSQTELKSKVWNRNRPRQISPWPRRAAARALPEHAGPRDGHFVLPLLPCLAAAQHRGAHARRRRAHAHVHGAHAGRLRVRGLWQAAVLPGDAPRRAPSRDGGRVGDRSRGPSRHAHRFLSARWEPAPRATRTPREFGTCSSLSRSVFRRPVRAKPQRLRFATSFIAVHPDFRRNVASPQHVQPARMPCTHVGV